ncbi:hypothetical protein GCM10023206_05110 [Acinetobacter puyangensis]|uniref:Uncharacterized protein n=1 Tax=Acinetobacter puyangensis TaxID=1096779 RepID=A0A240EBK0_9GAMM|nr:hypothetical protein [Acinetobacter puyangensis]SNX45906.1 hypothetical protein SAMN05421731_106141 [Acinetobacter puyangensis]
MDGKSFFKIKSIKLQDSSTCELYMENVDDASVKGWVINNNNGSLMHRFHEHLNSLCNAENPFQTLLELKQFYRVDVLN